MATRRCQLITQAYLRGHLRPDFPFGATSRLREMLILDTLDGELVAESLDRQVALTASLISGANLEMGSRKKLLLELERSLERAELLRLADFDGAVEHQFVNSSLAAETVHGLMCDAGLLGDRSGLDEQPTDDND